MAGFGGGRPEEVGEYLVNSYDILGHGAFGIVTTGTNNKGETIAAKRISLVEEGKARKISQELDRLKTLDHPNIVEIFDVYRYNSVLWIMMEYCQFKTLKQFFEKVKENLKEQVTIMLQIAQGIEYLHSKDIVHRDIKPANILVAQEKPVVVKLTDFDVSKFHDPDYVTSCMSSNVGTPAFKAPEYFQRSQEGDIAYHRNVDIFAAGLTFLAMIQGNERLVPRIETGEDESERFQTIGQLIQERRKLNKKNLEILRNNTSESYSTKEIRELIREMTRAEPKDRVGATEVVRRLKGEYAGLQISERRSSLRFSGFKRKSQGIPSLEDGPQPPPQPTSSKSVVVYPPAPNRGQEPTPDGAQPPQRTTQLKVKLLITHDTRLVGWACTSSTVMETGHIVLRGKTSEESPLALYMFLHGSEGFKKVREVKGFCEHGIGVYLEPVKVKDQEFLAVSCPLCRKIRLYDMNSEKVTTAFYNRKYYPLHMSAGEEGVMYVEHSVKGFPVLKLNTEQIPFTGPHKTIQSGMERYHSMIHIPAPHNLLVFSDNLSATIRAVSTITREEKWELRGEVGGRKCQPHGMFFSQDHQALLVADGKNRRILVLNLTDGSVINTVQLDYEMGVIVQLRIQQQKLIVHHTDGEKEKVSFFSTD